MPDAEPNHQRNEHLQEKWLCDLPDPDLRPGHQEGQDHRHVEDRQYGEQHREADRVRHIARGDGDELRRVRSPCGEAIQQDPDHEWALQGKEDAHAVDDQRSEHDVGKQGPAHERAVLERGQHLVESHLEASGKQHSRNEDGDREIEDNVQSFEH
jgi:hypothetical protein